MRYYEIYGYLEDGWCFEVVNFRTATKPDYEADAEAYEVAQHYARLWTESVKLYRVPDANETSASSFNLWPDQMELITEIPLKLKPSMPDPDDEVLF